MAKLTPKGHSLGWTPSKPDFRDYVYKESATSTLPAAVDLRNQMLFVRDQAQLGSCTSFGATAMAYHTYVKDGWHNPFPPSPLFTYYTERQVEDTTGWDSGGSGRDVVQALARFGMTAETNWPYDVSKFTHAPSAAVYANAARHEAKVYMGVPQTVNAMRGCLAEGYTFVIGFSVYDSFESDVVASTGVVPMPGASENLLGGHMTVVCGYDMANKLFLSQNSWGSSWGLSGYFWIPFDYLTSGGLSSDFWTLRKQM